MGWEKWVGIQRLCGVGAGGQDVDCFIDRLIVFI